MRAAVQENITRVINTTVGRVIFNDQIPKGLSFVNGTLKKKDLAPDVLALGREAVDASGVRKVGLHMKDVNDLG